LPGRRVSFDAESLPSVPEHSRFEDRSSADSRSGRACDMAACDTHEFCEDDTRDWDQELDVEREEVVDMSGCTDIPANHPRYSYMLSVAQGQIGLTTSNYAPKLVYVKHVVPHSPASRVYVDVGDEILAINGLPVCEMDKTAFDMNMRQRPLVLWMHRTEARRMSL